MAGKDKQDLTEKKEVLDVTEMQEKILALEAKYSQLLQSVTKLEKEQSSLAQNINTMYASFDNMNRNVENIMEKVNKLCANQEMSMMGRMFDKHRGVSLTRMVGSGARKVAVGAVTTALMVSDAVTETVAGVKEGFEDIVAEAQYMNQKRRMEQANGMTGLGPENMSANSC
jgi:predicted nuclease with TOPRIM domain